MNRDNLIEIKNEDRESARGIAFIKSHATAEQILKIVDGINELVSKNGASVKFAYRDTSRDFHYNRTELREFLAFLKNEDVQVIVIRSLNEITDNMADLEKFIRTINNMGIWIYCLAVGPVPVTVSHAEDFGY